MSAVNTALLSAISYLQQSMKPAQPRWPALMGDSNGQLHIMPISSLLPANPRFWVRMFDNRTVVALCHRFTPTYNEPVWVGHLPDAPTVLQVLALRESYSNPLVADPRWVCLWCSGKDTRRNQRGGLECSGCAHPYSDSDPR